MVTDKDKRKRSGSAQAIRDAAIGKQKDRGGKNIGADKEEHSRLPKGNKTQKRGR